jgi:hypothetical protein
MYSLATKGIAISGFNIPFSALVYSRYSTVEIVQNELSRSAVIVSP